MNGTEAIFSGLANGEVYTVTVKAYVLDRKDNKVFSELVGAETVTPPAAAKGLVLTASGYGEAPSVKAHWEAVEGADGYMVELEPAAEGTGSVEMTETEAVFDGLEYATTYKVSVIAFIRYGGEPVLSAAVDAEAETDIPDLVSPVLKAEGISTSEIKLTWELVEGATGYQIKVTNETDKDIGLVIYEAGDDETEYIDSEINGSPLTPGCRVFYTISAKFGDHVYEASEIVRGTTLGGGRPSGPPPDVPHPEPPKPKLVIPEMFQ